MHETVSSLSSDFERFGVRLVSQITILRYWIVVSSFSWTWFELHTTQQPGLRTESHPYRLELGVHGDFGWHVLDSHGLKNPDCTIILMIDNGGWAVPMSGDLSSPVFPKHDCVPFVPPSSMGMMATKERSSQAIVLVCFYESSAGAFPLGKTVSG